MKSYFILHGSFSNPYENWFPWLFNILKSDGKRTYCPQFPVCEFQNYDNWSKVFNGYVDSGLINEETVIIAHGIAPIFVIKYLIEHNMKVARLIFVTGCNKIISNAWEYDNVSETMFTDNIERIHDYCSDIVCFYSDNDPYVPYKDAKDFADKVANVHEFIQGAGHITTESGYDRFEQIMKYL